MQSYITLEQLREIGVTLEGEELESLLIHLNTTVEERVGADIAMSLDNEKLDELLILQETADDEKLHDWITKNIPDSEKVIKDVIDITLGELADSANDL